MSSKEKDGKTFNARLKDFFKKPLGNPGGKHEFTLSQEVIRDLSRESPLQTRLKTLKDLCSVNVVEKLWSCTEDLYSKDHTEARHQLFFFMQCLVKGQTERLTLMRAQFFRLIKHHDHPEDIGQKLDLLIALTSNGKVVLFFEEEIGRFLLNWLPEISQVGKIEDYLMMIDNVIHYNAAYLDEEIINGFIEHICLLCSPTSQSTTIKLCLQTMSSIVAYSNMSPDSLPKFIGALCRTVIDQKYCQRSWQALKGNHPAVAYEVALAIQQLINRHGLVLMDSSWSVIIRIISNILCIANTEPNPHNIDLKSIIMSSMNTIENYIELGQYNGHIGSYYKLLEECAIDRPDESILKLLEHLSKHLNPCDHLWLNQLNNLFVVFFRSEMRPVIRLKVLQILTDIFKLNKEQYEEDIIDKIVIVHTSLVVNDHDMLVKTSVIKMLVEMCMFCESKRCLELLDILERFLNRPFDNACPESDYQDIICLATGLTALFVKKIYKLPSAHALRIYTMLLTFLEKHYSMPVLFQDCPQIRYTNEKDWEILNLVLSGIPKGLQNKSLVIGKGNNELDLLVSVLCSMVSDKQLNLPESLNVKINKADFHSNISLVLVNLSSYHSYLDNPSQTKMIRCIMKCIQSAPKSSKPSISALTICTLEMKDVMVKILPEVLLNLSKMSPTNHVAVPVLEFLSTMTQLPTIFANFVADQYMAVFAVALPYSNPFRFNHYIVSLAHHVIAVWFLKCRLTFRRDFVRFITNGLKTNLQPNEETFFGKLDLTSINQDSSDRKRSSSLTEQGSRRRDERTLPVRMDKGVIMKKGQPPNKQLSMFYEELPGAEFLLNEGQSKTWLVGNKLVTVTTSGCSQKVMRQGLCDKCWIMCNTKTDKKFLTTGSTSTETSRQNSSNSVNSPQEETAKLVEESVANRLQETFKKEEIKEENYTCACWCQGWAEVYIRKPTGDVSWIMRIQNDIAFTHETYEFPLNDVSTLYGPNEEPQRPVLVRQDTFDSNNDEEASVDTPKPTTSRQNSQDSIEEENEEIVYEDGTKARNPVRRSNSSPEMSANWKNPFHKLGSSSSASSESDNTEDKKPKLYSMDMRVSCEAIPEEIAGTSPPQAEHPSLISYHSFPGSSEPHILPKLYQTVPPSPAIQTEFQQRPTSLGSLQPLAGKPPQSPTQTSPRLSRHNNKGGQELQKSSSSSIVLDRNSHLTQARERAKERKISGSTERLSSLDPNQPLARRERGHTISVMPIRSRPRSEPIKPLPRSGVNPSFVFLQLYHSAYFTDYNRYEKPLIVGTSDVVNRSINLLDKVPPYEMHKVGVIYIREGQVNNEAEILRNSFGSLRYIEFLQKLGSLVKIADTEPQLLGGLDENGNDGKFTYLWKDDVVRVTFHVATLMPNKDSDPNCNNKKMHIGNDYVIIVYNESKEEFDMKTIKSQFNFASIIIQPLDHGINKVIMKIKDVLKDLAVVGNDPKIVSDQNVAILARQLAIHANLASLVATSLKQSPSDPYASTWLERLRQIKKVRKKVLDEQKNEEQNNYPTEEVKSKKPIEDFTEYS
ncbi:unnamed protein product [Ceutorhynchus assimilis]|uniref:Rap-GAP domain-containing protein n=1 Tax=Ceutorhynchus assimilis TaxID=467358 RepID=A0A9N9N0W3_9CUCU|nr:unnamed protein product [Ceutorhynchus assimilis]